MILRIWNKFRKILSKHQKHRIIQLVFLMIIGGFLEMCSVSLVVPFMNAVMNPEEMMDKWYSRILIDIFGVDSANDFILIFAILLALIYVLKNVYLLVEFDIQYRFVYNNMFLMQQRLMDNYIHRDYEYYLKVNSGELVRVVNSDTSNAFILLSTMLSMVTELVVSAVLVITLFVITPKTTLFLALMMSLLLLLIAKVIKPVLQKEGKVNQESMAGMNKWLLQSIEGIKEIKVSGKEAFFQKKFDEYGEKYVTALRKYFILNISPRFIIEAVSMGTMFVVIALLISAGENLSTIIPILTAVAMAAIRLLPSVNRMSNSLATMNFYEPMLDKLVENLDDINRNDGKEKSVSDEREDNTDENLNNEYVIMDGVSFRYPGTSSDILSNVTLNIKEGESIGIVGTSGSGKTTTIDILMGLLHPQEGRILINGSNIYSDITSWHKKIGYIPQTIFLLDDSIKNNICFGEEEISDDLLWKSLKDAALDEFVKQLPDGVNTQIGERGVRLSGGQRQRIGIARALYRNPTILVFDEATSALDNETESDIMESINSLKGTKTMIVIAHRLSTIESCDHIYRVESGEIQRER